MTPSGARPTRQQRKEKEQDARAAEEAKRAEEDASRPVEHVHTAGTGNTTDDLSAMYGM